MLVNREGLEPATILEILKQLIPVKGLDGRAGTLGPGVHWWPTPRGFAYALGLVFWFEISLVSHAPFISGLNTTFKLQADRVRRRVSVRNRKDAKLRHTEIGRKRSLFGRNFSNFDVISRFLFPRFSAISALLSRSCFSVRAVMRPIAPQIDP